MKRRVQLSAAAILIILTMANVPPARADGPGASHTAAAVRIVNVTSDSAPGWLPSADQSRAAGELALAYLAARDAGRAEAAYAMLEDDNRSLQPFISFIQEINNFNIQADAVVERCIVNVTCTKDPAQAPRAGVYAAIDLVSRFVNIDRDYGYIVVYQPPVGGPFRVGR